MHLIYTSLIWVHNTKVSTAAVSNSSTQFMPHSCKCLQMIMAGDRACMLHTMQCSMVHCHYDVLLQILWLRAMNGACSHFQHGMSSCIRKLLHACAFMLCDIPDATGPEQVWKQTCCLVIVLLICVNMSLHLARKLG